MRVTLLAIVALAAAVLAGCGSSGGGTVAGGFTVPTDVHDLYGEVESILDQLPYQSWYTKCVVSRVKKAVSPKEAEELAGLPESERESKASKVVAKAKLACEESSKRPVIDPNASEKELGLYRASYVSPLREIAEADKFDEAGVACVEEAVESLPAKKVITLGNGTRKARAAILVSILTPCASSK